MAGARLWQAPGCGRRQTSAGGRLRHAAESETLDGSAQRILIYTAGSRAILFSQVFPSAVSKFEWTDDVILTIPCNIKPEGRPEVNRPELSQLKSSRVNPTRFELTRESSQLKSTGAEWQNFDFFRY